MLLSDFIKLCGDGNPELEFCVKIRDYGGKERYEQFPWVTLKRVKKENKVYVRLYYGDGYWIEILE